MFLEILFFKVLMNLPAITDSLYLCAEYISISLLYKKDFIDLFENSLPSSNFIFFDLQLDLLKFLY